MGAAVGKYLARHAEPEVAGVRLVAAHGPWDHAVVIPARREASSCLSATSRAAQGCRVLCVWVVNGTTKDDQQLNADLLHTVRSHPTLHGEPPCGLHRLPGFDVLLVDRSGGGHRFGPKDGVGLARKIGADWVLGLWDAGAVGSPWIHNTDADAKLPADHFTRISPHDGAAGAVAPFRHVPGGDADVDQATALYDRSLRYYVAGLRWAGSPYAFHTVGSTLSVSTWAYAAVRGFPKRQAGEDFYLLNKLAKVGSVVSQKGHPVQIRARSSDRVPFGTGPAVRALVGGAVPTLYDPRVFGVVADTLRAMAAATSQGDGRSLDALRTAHPDLPELGRLVVRLQQLQQRYPPSQWARRMHACFDALRTLKLIHDVTDRRWPRCLPLQALAAAPFEVPAPPDAPLRGDRSTPAG